MEIWVESACEYRDVDIRLAADVDLLEAYGAEEDAKHLRISSDPPSPINALRDEILRRMSAYKR
jgi:hypothetical protein